MAADPSLIPLTQARRRIHAAAMKLFAESGETKVSISELATAAGMAAARSTATCPTWTGCSRTWRASWLRK